LRRVVRKKREDNKMAKQRGENRKKLKMFPAEMRMASLGRKKTKRGKEKKGKRLGGNTLGGWGLLGKRQRRGSKKEMRKEGRS